MLLGDTLILDDLDCANKYRQQVSTLVVNACQGDVTSDDLQQRYLAQVQRCNIVATLIQMVATLFQHCRQCCFTAGYVMLLILLITLPCVQWN